MTPLFVAPTILPIAPFPASTLILRVVEAVAEYGKVKFKVLFVLVNVPVCEVLFVAVTAVSVTVLTVLLTVIVYIFSALVLLSLTLIYTVCVLLFVKETSAAVEL